jgi:hypothetical protein
VGPDTDPSKNQNAIPMCIQIQNFKYDQYNFSFSFIIDLCGSAFRSSLLYEFRAEFRARSRSKSKSNEDPDPGADQNVNPRAKILDVTIIYPFLDGEKMTKFDKT